MIRRMLQKSLIELKNGEFRDLMRKSVASGLRKFAPGLIEFPHRLVIELTNHCNLDCIMCPRKLRTDGTGYMAYELFEKVADECSKSYYFGELILSGLGEPLLHPEITDLIKLAKAKGLPKVRLTTNAVLLTKEKTAEIINESGLDEIGISLDALTAETYKKTKRRQHFLKVKNNILNFLNQRKKQGLLKPFVKLHMLKLQETASEVDGFIEQWRPLMGKGDRILLKDVHTYSGMVENIRIQEQVKYATRSPCSQLWTLLFISWSGDVMPCCAAHSLGQSKIGNLKDASVKAIWTGGGMQRLREIHASGQYEKIPHCSPCEVWWYFGKKQKTI